MVGSFAVTENRKNIVIRLKLFSFLFSAAKGGKFSLKSKHELERMEKEKEEKTKRISKKYHQQRSILDRDSTIQRYESFRNMPQPSEKYTQSWEPERNHDLDTTPVRDTSTENDIDSLYAKVDKKAKRNAHNENAVNDITSRNSENATNPANVIPTIEVTNSSEGNSSPKRSNLGPKMSLISEDLEYYVPEKPLEDDSTKLDDYVDEDEAEDGYTPLSAITSPMTSRSKELTVRIPKDKQSLGK